VPYAAALALSAWLASGAPADGAPAPAPRPSLLLVTVDTLRPDALGWISGVDHTPTIDRLANAGVAFPSAVSPVPLTLPAHASLFSARLPRRHGVQDNGQTLPASIPLLAERLKAAGYRTAAFVSGFPLQGMFGLARGFDHYDDRLPDGSEGWLERRANATSAAAAAWLKNRPGPWFVWLHYYDPHDPYEPPRAFWRPGRRGAYDGEVAFVDNALGGLLASLGPRPNGSLLTIVTADHGEALGEHGEHTHGYFLYDSTMRVPLVFHWPGRLVSRRSDEPARLIDVAPTVLALLGLPPLADADGVSLTPLLHGQPQQVPGAYLETRLPWTYFGWAPLRAWRERAWKWVAAPRPELYSLADDPHETRDLATTAAPEAARLRLALEALERTPASEAQALVDPGVLERLRALGYVGAGGHDTSAPPAGLPDPKDRLALRQRLLDAEAELRQQRLGSALAGFEAALREEPENRMAALRSGVLLLRLGRVQAAVERLGLAVRLDPQRAEARFALADALVRAGQPKAALEHWMELTRLQPGRFEAWFNLGSTLLETGRARAAASAFQEALLRRPGERGARVALGRAELLAGAPAEALRHLRAVAPARVQSFEGAAALGLAWARRGRPERARPWLEVCQPSQPDYAEAQAELARLEARAGRGAAACAAWARAQAAGLTPAPQAEPSLRDCVRARDRSGA
jgi:arylsulfatase A-like enzyme/Flp pilus assembly protein TadD